MAARRSGKGAAAGQSHAPAAGWEEKALGPTIRGEAPPSTPNRPPHNSSFSPRPREARRKMSDGGPRTGFLGAGRMATALARAWTAARKLSPDRVLASDPVASARDVFRRESGCPVTHDNRAVAAQAELL